MDSLEQENIIAKAIIKMIGEQRNIENIILEPNKSNTLLSLKIGSHILCRVKCSGKKQYIEIPAIYSGYINEQSNLIQGNLIIEQLAGSAYLRIMNPTIQLARNFTTLWLAIYDDLNGTNQSFGCCSRYLQCSKAGKCIHLDTVFAKGCHYQEHLKKGEIFYF